MRRLATIALALLLAGCANWRPPGMPDDPPDDAPPPDLIIREWAGDTAVLEQATRERRFQAEFNASVRPLITRDNTGPLEGCIFAGVANIFGHIVALENNEDAVPWLNSGDPSTRQLLSAGALALSTAGLAKLGWFKTCQTLNSANLAYMATQYESAPPNPCTQIGFDRRCEP